MTTSILFSSNGAMVGTMIGAQIARRKREEAEKERLQRAMLIEPIKKAYPALPFYPRIYQDIDSNRLLNQLA